MDKQYLLTYHINGDKNFMWFDTEEELRDFVDNTKDITVFDALKIPYVEELEVRHFNQKG